MNDRLRQARTAAGFASARSAAMRHKFGVSTFAAHENGQNDFDPEVAAKYAKAFRTTASWLLTGEGDGPAGRPPIVGSFDPDEPDRRIVDSDPIPHDRSGKLIDLRELPPGSIPELVAEGGMGPGHVIQSQEHGSLYTQDEIKDEFWSFPQTFVRSTMGTTAANLIAIECTGDSMEPTLKPNERVWVNVSHKRPTPDGIYAIRDALGAPVIKRLELGEGNPPVVRIISDNPLHSRREVSIEDLQIIGKVVAGLRLF